jgi:hypothetical protein
MDNDQQLRAQVVSALEAVTPPAPWLEATIRGSLRANPRRGRRQIVAPTRFATRALLPALAIAVMLLLVATAVGIYAMRSFQHPVPAHRADSDVVRYAALLKRDKLLVDDASGYTVQVGVPPHGGFAFGTDRVGDGTGCDGGPPDSGCPVRLGRVETAYQLWLDDLDHTTPPARFAADHVRMRADLQALIEVFRVALADYNQAPGFNTPPGIFDPGNLGRTSTQVHPRDELLTIEAYVVYESKGGAPVRDAATATYTAMVARDYDNLHLMTLFICRHEDPVCGGPAATTRSGVQAFLSDLNATTPPARSATMHRALVTSLETELRSLDQVDSAISAGTDDNSLGHLRDALLADFNARRDITTTTDAILYAR